jgi:hypothetical protein
LANGMTIKSCGMMSSKIKYTTPANQILLF